MTFVIGLAGAGDSSGVHARQFEIDANGQVTGQRVRISAFNADWVLIENIKAGFASNAQLYRAARFLDRDKRIWTWLGRYETTKVAFDHRAGYYLGAGLGFLGAADSRELRAFVDQVFQWARDELIADGTMKPLSTINPVRDFRVDLMPPEFGSYDLHGGLTAGQSSGFASSLKSLQGDFLQRLLVGKDAAAYSVGYLRVGEDAPLETFHVDVPVLQYSRPPASREDDMPTLRPLRSDRPVDIRPMSDQRRVGPDDVDVLARRIRVLEVDVDMLMSRAEPRLRSGTGVERGRADEKGQNLTLTLVALAGCIIGVLLTVLAMAYLH